MNINYEYYKVFYYVAKYKSFSKAATKLMSNQPNVTRTIKILENDLGCTLFIRSNKGVTLTAEGEKLLSHVSVAVEAIQKGENELALAKNLESGSVAISVTETALHELLLSALDNFHTKYPQIKIHLSNHSTPQAINAIRNKAVELAVVTTPVTIVKPLRETHLQTFREILVCGRKFSKLKNRKLSLEKLQEYPLICLGKSTTTYEFYRDFFLKHDIMLEPDMEAATTDQILPMVKSNLGLGFVPESLAIPAIESGEVFRVQLDEEVPERYVCLIKNKDQPLSTSAREFEKMLHLLATDNGM